MVLRTLFLLLAVGALFALRILTPNPDLHSLINLGGTFVAIVASINYGYYMGRAADAPEA